MLTRQKRQRIPFGPGVSFFLLFGVLLTGCATVPNRYIPKTVGSLDDADKSNSLRISIESMHPQSFVGQPIVFQVAIKNVGEIPLWIPRDPEFFFAWIYPDGRRDSFIYEPSHDQFYSQLDAVSLRPGEQMLKPVTIRTYYFQQNGITEFRAYLRIARNTNSELNPFFDDELASNSYGVMVLGAKKGHALETATTKSMLQPPSS